MTVKELYEKLKEVVEKGKGHADVVFDSEAARFNVHLVNIGEAYFESEEDTGFDMVVLHYERGTPLER